MRGMFLLENDVFDDLIKQHPAQRERRAHFINAASMSAVCVLKCQRKTQNGTCSTGVNFPMKASLTVGNFGVLQT